MPIRVCPFHGLGASLLVFGGGGRCLPQPQDRPVSPRLPLSPSPAAPSRASPPRGRMHRAPGSPPPGRRMRAGPITTPAVRVASRQRQAAILRGFLYWCQATGGGGGRTKGGGGFGPPPSEPSFLSTLSHAGAEAKAVDCGIAITNSWFATVHVRSVPAPRRAPPRCRMHSLTDRKVFADHHTVECPAQTANQKLSDPQGCSPQLVQKVQGHYLGHGGLWPWGCVVWSNASVRGLVCRRPSKQTFVSDVLPICRRRSVSCGRSVRAKSVLAILKHLRPD